MMDRAVSAPRASRPSWRRASGGAARQRLALAGWRAAARPPQELRPEWAQPGAAVPAPVARLLDDRADADPSPAALTVVFLSRRCGACRALVDALRAAPRRGAGAPPVLVVVDSAWPEAVAALDDAGYAHRTSAASLATVRATPTAVALDRRTRQVQGVAVGVTAVLEALGPSPSLTRRGL